MDNAANSNRQGPLLGWSLIVTLVFLQIAAIVAGLPSPGEPKESSIGLLFLSAMFVLLGVSFVAAYYYPERTFFFRGLMWLSDQLHFPPRTRKFAFLLAFMCFTVGIGALLQSLGVL